MTRIRTEIERQTDGLVTQDIRFGHRITILMQTESFGLSISIAIWELIKKKLTHWSKRFGFAPSAATRESNTSSSTAKL